MRTCTVLKRSLLTMTIAGLAGCSTPKAALDQANHATKLMSLLEIQLAEFRRVQEGAEQSRVESLRTQKSVLVGVEAASQLDIAASKSAGDTVREPLSAKMLADAEGVSTVRARVLASKDSYDQKLSTLLAPLPSTTAAMAQAQGKMAEMGTELSLSTRYSEILAFAKDIKASVDANKKKIKDAEDAAAATDQAVKADVQKDAATASVQPPAKP